MYQDLFSKTGLSLERLLTLCEIEQAGGITKAAKGDPNRQSQYSRQVKELEEFFGVDLITKQGRGRVLTEKGRELARQANLSLQGLDQFTKGCRNQPQQISLGAGESHLKWAVLPHLKNLQKALPNFSFQFHNRRTQDIIEELQKGTLDFGIIRSDAVPASLKQESVGSLGYSLFVPSRFAKKKSKTEKLDLGEIPLVTLDGGGDYCQSVDKFCEDHPEYRIRLRVSSLPLVATAMVEGEYAGILPAMVRGEMEKAGFVTRALGKSEMEVRRISLVWSPRTAAIRDCLEKAQTQLVPLLKKALVSQAS